MKTLLFVLLCLSVCFALNSKKLLKKSRGCTNPSYVISALDGQFLDLPNIQNCNSNTNVNAILTRLYGSWCISSNNLIYNGQRSMNGCLVLLNDNSGVINGIFPQPNMNQNWLGWSIESLGDGYSVIFNNGPSGNLNSQLALTWNGNTLSFSSFTNQNGQRWLVAPATN